MTTDIVLTPVATLGEAQPEAAARSPHKLTPGFGCVYLTTSVREAERASALVESAQIHIYHAACLADAEAQLKLTKSRVLLSNTTFQRGNWKDALQMTLRLYPAIALVVAARLADERLWIGVLERGAYDLIEKPFRPDELQSILENAHRNATTGTPLHMTA